jgi:hypothetical protein
MMNSSPICVLLNFCVHWMFLHVIHRLTSSNIKKRTRTTECHLSSHTILRSVIYPASFVSTGQPYKNTQNCVKSLDVFARHASSRITFLTLTIVGWSRGDVSSHQDVFQTFGFPEGQDGSLSKRLNGHRSDANCKPDLPLSRHLRSTGHHDSLGKLLQWPVSKMWSETMYDVQKHPMHTKIHQHTYIPTMWFNFMWYSLLVYSL